MDDEQTANDRRSIVASVLTASIRAHERMRDDGAGPLIEAAGAIGHALAEGGKVLAFGNGGSAADAQHFVAELIGRFERARRGLAAVALTADAAVVTSLANDYGFERIFACQIEALGTSGDVAVGISTSGRSPNVAAGLAAAASRGLVTVALTGHDGGPVGRAAAIQVNVPETSTPRIQEVHRTLLHILAALVERDEDVIRST